MNLGVSLVLIVVGLALVIFFSEELVEGAVGTSLGFGVSTFLISVIFFGFDPENLALGGVASYEGATGIALGSIVGATMVAIAFAFGITAILAPMEFGETPRSVLLVPVLASVLLLGLSLDGQLSRVDGAMLLAGFVLAILFLISLSRRGVEITATGEVAEALAETEVEHVSRWRSLGLLVVSLIAIIIGSEMVVSGSEEIIERLGLSDTVFGMTILALLIDMEELARELPAAMRGRPEMSYGNVSGSILAFFLFNAGVVALVNPLEVNDETLTFFLPLCLITVVVVTLFMLRKRVSRGAGVVLLALYAIFFVGGFFV